MFVFVNLFHVCFIRKDVGFHVYFYIFILLWYVVLEELYEENLASHRCVVGKGRSILSLFR